MKAAHSQCSNGSDSCSGARVGTCVSRSRTGLVFLILLILGAANGAFSADALRGRVVNSAGEGVPDARVILATTGSPALCPVPETGTVRNIWQPDEDATRDLLRRFPSVLTDQEGWFSLPAALEEESHSLCAISAPGYAPSLSRCDARSARTLRVAPGSDLQIDMRSPDETPSVNARVSLIPLDMCETAITVFRDVFVRTGGADSEGVISIENVAPGLYAILIEAMDGRTETVGPVKLGGKSDHLRIRWIEGGGLRGSLVFPSGESPRPGRVQALWHGSGGILHGAETVLSDQGAEWSLPGMPRRGTVWVQASADGGWTSSIAVLHGAETFGDPLALRMRAPVTLQGTWGGTTGETVSYMAVASGQPFGPPGPVLFGRVASGRDRTFTLPYVPETVELLWLSSQGAGCAVVSRTDRHPGEALGEVVLLSENCITESSPEDPQDGGWRPYEICVTPSQESSEEELDVVEILSDSGDDAGSPGGRWYAKVRNGCVRLPIAEPGRAIRAIGYPGGGSMASRARSGRVDLAPPLSVSGSVVDSSGVALAGVEVEIRPAVEDSETTQLARVLRTDGEGVWSWMFPGPGLYEVIASAPGYLPGSARITVSPTSGQGPHVLTLHRTGSLEGHVFGVPAECTADIRVLKTDGGVRPEGLRTEAADGERFVFDDLAPGQYMVFASVTDPTADATITRSANCQVAEGAVAYVDFNVGAGVLLSGTVYLKDEVVSDGTIGFERRAEGELTFDMASTNEQGRYSIVLPEAGRYEVKLVKEASRLLGQTRLKIKVRDETTQELDLRFTAGVLRGKLVTRDGAPVSRAGVWLFLEAADGAKSVGASKMILAQVESEAEATFEFPGLEPGKYFLGIEAQGFAKKTVGPIRVEENGETQLPDVVMEEQVGLSVSVHGPGGQPLSGAIVAAFAGGDFRDVTLPPNAATGSDGTAVLEGLARGTYTLVALFSGLAPGFVDGVRVEESEPENPVALSLSPGGSVEVRVSDTSGTPIAYARIELIDSGGRDVTRLYETLVLMSGRSAETNDQGALKLEHVVPGVYFVRVAPPLAGEPGQATVSEGQLTLTQIYGLEPSE